MWPQLIVVTLLAAIAQGVAGFGFTLLAVSFCLLILQSTEAVQLAIIINFAISAVLVGRLWQEMQSLWKGFFLVLISVQAGVSQLRCSSRG